MWIAKKALRCLLEHDTFLFGCRLVFALIIFDLLQILLLSLCILCCLLTLFLFLFYSARKRNHKMELKELQLRYDEEIKACTGPCALFTLLFVVVCCLFVCLSVGAICRIVCVPLCIFVCMCAILFLIARMQEKNLAKIH